MGYITIFTERISIHALREEGDLQGDRGDIQTCKFLSTPSVRRATDYRLVRLGILNISIHALREEGDAAAFILVPAAIDFYPRPP